MDLTLRAVLLVTAGGAIGAPLRLVMTVLLSNRLNQPDFPVGTLVVNVVGSFLLGLLTWTTAGRLGVSTSTRLLLGTGILGAFTTYSAFSVETVSLFGRGRGMYGVGYIALTAGLAIAAAMLGMRLGKAL